MTTPLRNTSPQLLAAAATLLLAACSEKTETFYTARYDILRVEALVEQAAPEPAAASDDTPAAPTDEALAAIAAEVVASSPVVAGGSYTLDFDRYDGGKLTLVTTPGTEPQQGTFTKQPGADSIRFIAGELDNTVFVGSYDPEAGGRPCVRFETDLTAAYRERYPSLDLRRVVRNEYTATHY